VISEGTKGTSLLKYGYTLVILKILFDVGYVKHILLILSQGKMAKPWRIYAPTWRAT
jgi:hypothetical protein